MHVFLFTNRPILEVLGLKKFETEKEFFNFFEPKIFSDPKLSNFFWVLDSRPISNIQQIQRLKVRSQPKQSQVYHFMTS